MSDDKYLTSKELAKLLNVSPAWCEYHRWKGDGIPFVRIGTRTVRYKRTDVDAWIEKQSRVNTCDALYNGGSNGK